MLEAISKTPQEDDNASELKHAEEIFGVIFVPNDEPPEIV
jgi:hypothetical protein